MADNRIYPSWEQIKNLKNPLTSGEWTLAKYLDTHLPAGWEIFVQPYLNGDRPDIVILNKNIGMMVFEVKDWSPGLYKSQTRTKMIKGKYRTIREFFVKSRNGEYEVINPVNQVERYRRKLIGFYLPEIGESIEKNVKRLSAFKIGLYFHKMTTDTARELVKANPRRCVVFGNDLLKGNSVSQIVPDAFRKNSYSRKKNGMIRSCSG